MQASSSAVMGVWVELEWLLSLPLEGQALTILWSSVLGGGPHPQSIRAGLVRALDQQAGYHARARCLDGHWWEGLQRLDELLRREWPEESMARFVAAIGYEVVLELHRRLIEEETPAEEFNEEQRAQLLWHGHVLLELLEPLAGTQPLRLPVVSEHIARYGALAWIPQQGAEARGRAIQLLRRLAELNEEARNWVEPALQELIAQDSPLPAG